MSTLPPFEGLHPLAVHFPIGLLLTVWIPAIIACFVKRDAKKHWWTATLLWYALGVTGAMFAVITGEAAADIVGPATDEISALIHDHEEGAELARTIYIVSFLAFLAAFLLRVVWNKKRPIVLAAAMIAIATYLAATAILIPAAHKGAELVHTHGIHAPM